MVGAATEYVGAATEYETAGAAVVTGTKLAVVVGVGTRVGSKGSDSKTGAGGGGTFFTAFFFFFAGFASAAPAKQQQHKNAAARAQSHSGRLYPDEPDVCTPELFPELEKSWSFIESEALESSESPLEPDDKSNAVIVVDVSIVSVIVTTAGRLQQLASHSKTDVQSPKGLVRLVVPAGQTKSTLPPAFGFGSPHVPPAAGKSTGAQHLASVASSTALTPSFLPEPVVTQVYSPHVTASTGKTSASARRQMSVRTMAAHKLRCKDVPPYAWL